MATSDMISIATKAASTFVGLESTYATLPTMTRAFPVGTSKIVLEQDNLPNDDEREHLFKRGTHVQGLKKASAEIEQYFKLGTQLVAAATASTHGLGIVLQNAFGGLGGSAAGTTVAGTGSDTDTVNTASATNFPVGGWLAAEVSGALVPRRIVAKTSNAIDVYPAFGGTPTATTGLVVNAQVYYPTQATPSSLYFQHAKTGDTTNSKWSLAGGRSGLALSLARGQPMSAKATTKFATWSFTSSDTIAVTALADAMSAPVVMKDATVLVQSASTVTAVHYQLHSLEVMPPDDMGVKHIEELGGTEGTSGILRTGVRPFGKVKIKFRYDPTIFGASTDAYRTQTFLGIVCIVPITGATALLKRFVIIDMPSCLITAVPNVVDEGGHQAVECELECFTDATTTLSGLSGSGLDLALAPMRVILL